MTTTPDDDPVRARRARIARLTRLGKGVGYSFLVVAMVAFAVGAVVDFTQAVVTVVVAALALGSAVLLPAIILGYGVMAADREERGGGSFH